MKAGYKIVESRIPDQRELLLEDLAEGRAQRVEEGKERVKGEGGEGKAMVGEEDRRAIHSEWIS